MWRRRADDFEESGYKTEAVVDEVKSRWLLDPVSVNSSKIQRNWTHLQQSCSYFQCVNRIPNGTEDTKGFQLDQKLLLQESMQDRGDGMCVGRYRARIKEVL